MSNYAFTKSKYIYKIVHSQFVYDKVAFVAVTNTKFGDYKPSDTGQ